MKKLLLFNVAVVFGLFLASVLPSYYINYPVYYSFINAFEQFEWTLFVGILIAGVLLSGVLGYYKSKSIPYPQRFLMINILLDIILLIFISIHDILVALDAKTEYEALSLKYKLKAKSDIKNDLIIYETFGFPVSLDSAHETEEKVDSLVRTYGITHNNIGCVITGPLLKAQSDYNALTEPYLDIRNGEGWKNRMQQQITQIRNN